MQIYSFYITVTKPNNTVSIQFSDPLTIIMWAIDIHKLKPTLSHTVQLSSKVTFTRVQNVCETGPGTCTRCVWEHAQDVSRNMRETRSGTCVRCIWNVHEMPHHKAAARLN